MMVENAFGRLKGRWRGLMKRCDMTISEVPTIVAACCVLHNICEMNKDGYDERWSSVMEEGENLLQPSTQVAAEEEASTTSANIRNALMRYFITN